MALTVEDRLEILEVVARCHQALDYGDVDGIVETYTADGVFIHFDGHHYRGSEELKALATKIAQEDGAGRHWTTNHIIEGDGDTAKHSCYLLVILLADEPTIFGVGRYDDELQKVDGAWRIVRRTLTREC